ncbi:acetyl-CoA synthetase-like protein [Biscogniauxia marginata]|nr:acetyl-CoA synthetase-like protein [Biscogniauxia marginata]
MRLAGGGIRLICTASLSPLTAAFASTSAAWTQHSRSLLHSLSAAVSGPAAVSPYISSPSCWFFSFFPKFGKTLDRLRMASSLTLPRLPIFDAISRHDPRSPAVVHCLSGRSFNYGELLPDVCRVRDQIHDAAGRSDIRGERIAFLVENSYDYVVTFLAILAARAIALPLSPPFPAPELQYILSHSEALLLVHSSKFAAKANEVLTTPFAEASATTDPNFKPSLKAVELQKHEGLGSDTIFYDTVTISGDTDAEGAGMMLYTSGTTARPKGVLLPESALTAQASALIKAWKYSSQDRLLHVLPLHHIHGTVNAILAPLFAGSTIEFLFPFNADAVWRRFANPFLETPAASPARIAAKLNGIAKGFSNGVTNGSTHSTPHVNGTTHSAAETNDTAHAAAQRSAVPSLLNADRISQVAAELYGIIRLATGATASLETAGATLSPRETNRIGQLAVELNEMARSTPPASIVAPSRAYDVVHPVVQSNGATNGSTNGSTHGSTHGSKEEDKFASMAKEKITFFTVVPTVYTRLLSTHKTLSPELAEAGRTAISPEHMRVSISGSAALPTPVKRAWKDLSRGNVLLERYGMTEVGMALSCGLDFTDRVDGSVGWPLPGVEARLFDTETNEIIPDDEYERSGEIQLRGANVFREYWANPTATAKEFVPADDGKGPWFKTGDVAVRRVVSAGSGASGPWARGPMYFILGRQSADIIKSGGEKVSALEVERELLSLPEVLEAAVLAVPSGRWGQKVGAVVILDGKLAPQGWTPMDMRRALRGRLANYKIPQVLRVVGHIPRNAMGKINKKDLLRQVFLDDFSGDES